MYNQIRVFICLSLQTSAISVLEAEIISSGYLEMDSERHMFFLVQKPDGNGSH